MPVPGFARRAQGAGVAGHSVLEGSGGASRRTEGRDANVRAGSAEKSRIAADAGRGPLAVLEGVRRALGTGRSTRRISVTSRHAIDAGAGSRGGLERSGRALDADDRSGRRGEASGGAVRARRRTGVGSVGSDGAGRAGGVARGTELTWGTGRGMALEREEDRKDCGKKSRHSERVSKPSGCDKKYWSYGRWREGHRRPDGCKEAIPFHFQTLVK